MKNTNKTVYTLYSEAKKRIILSLCRYTASEPLENEDSCVRILSVVSGGGRIQCENYEDEFACGDVYIFGGEKNFLLLPSSDVEIYLAKFNLSDFIDGDYKIFSKEIISSFLTHSERGFAKLCGIHANSKKILNSTFMIENEFENRNSCSEYVIKAHIALIISLIIQYFSADFEGYDLNRGTHFKDIEKSLIFINDNLSEKITLDELAKVANMGKTGYSLAFKSVTGMTVWEYILNARIELASRYLIEKGDELNVTEIAMLCGFNNTTHFINIFKRLRGNTPGNFKKTPDNPCF